MVHFIPSNQRRLVILASQADTAPVLICGGPGTGKSAVAQWIHANGPRAGFPYVVANHDSPLVDQIPSARSGTLLIQELTDWPLSEQKILLQFIKTKTISNLNGLSQLIHVRIIATSGHGVYSRAQGGLFNSELLDELNSFRIEMPELSERIEEFDDITLGVLSEITREVQKQYLRILSPEAWQVLRAYDWPGNIRELRNVLRVAVMSAQGDQIEAQNFPDFGHERVDFRASREQFEKVYLLELLKTFNFEIERTCRVTRMDRNVLLAKINKYQISLEKVPPAIG